MRYYCFPKAAGIDTLELRDGPTRNPRAGKSWCGCAPGR